MKGIFVRKITLAALALASSAALVGVTAVPAFAAATPVTVTVAGGGISIEAPTTSAALTKSSADANLDATATATLGATKVTDLRAGTTPWSATVSLPALSDGATTPKSISTTNATYLAGTTDLVGTVTMATIAQATGLDNASTPPTSQAASSVDGNNSASWTATLTVPIPDQVLADTYTGVMTQSVS